jgi:putative MATE family efflux protein
VASSSSPSSTRHYCILRLYPDNSGVNLASEKKPQGYGWNKQNFAIALPALIGMLADPILSLMDTAYVGRVGSIELAALGACTSIFHLAFNAFRATTAATTSLVASSLLTDEESAKEVTAISLWFGWWIGIAVSAALLLGGTNFLKSMGVSKHSELYPSAAAYLFTRAWAAPIVLLMMVSEGAFRGYANTIVPLTASLVAALINLVLDPVLMFKAGWGVKGAAAATGLAQVGAVGTYAFYLVRRGMLPSLRKGQFKTTGKRPTAAVFRTIVGANLAMLMKQGSMLLGWAYATARATRLGAQQVAAHQVALSVWLIFAFILDGAAVSAQVLMGRAYATNDRPQVRSLIRYMVQFALLQGVVSMLVLDGIDLLVPRLFTPDKVIQAYLHKLMGPLALQQVLVSLTLVLESLAIGASQFRILGVGSVLSTIASVLVISKQTSVQGIWAFGVTTLFVVRLLMAGIALVRAGAKMRSKEKDYNV